MSHPVVCFYNLRKYISDFVFVYRLPFVGLDVCTISLTESSSKPAEVFIDDQIYSTVIAG